MNDLQKSIVLSMAEHNMNKAEVARASYFSRGNVLYHCDVIKAQTGLDPRSFYDLIKLVEMVKEGEYG